MTAGSDAFEGKIENACNPISIPVFETIGFAVSNGKPGETVVVQTAGVVSSDSPEFYLVANGLSAQIQQALQGVGVMERIAEGSEFVLVVHANKTATLYPAGFAIAMRIRAKKDMRPLEVLYHTDVSDIERLVFPAIKFEEADKVVTVLKFGWKYVLFFDLTPDKNCDFGEMERHLGAMARRMMFEEVYQAVDTEAEAQRLVEAGWFPFNEIIGGEFEQVAKAYRHDFNVETSEDALANSFSKVRLHKMTARWWHCPEFKARETLLQEGLDNFVEQRWASSIKVLITEIEGILRDRYRSVLGDSAKIPAVLEHAIAEAQTRAGAPDSLYFSTAFLGYLNASFFANFSVAAGVTTASRHSVGHGAAPTNLYTRKRALQTILVLDQISRYLLAR